MPTIKTREWLNSTLKENKMTQKELASKAGLSDKQAQAILDMRMVRLTGLEREKIEGEYNDLVALIADLADILGNEQRIFQIIYDELLEIQERFGDECCTGSLVGDVL